MFTVSALALALLAASANAHTFLSSINGNQGAIRRFANFPRNFPLWNIASPDMTCGRGAEQKASSSVSIAAGSPAKLLWGHDNPGDDIIAKSHYGPCHFYLSKASEVNTGGWFKIFEYKYMNGQWCTDFLINAKGIIDIPIPKEIPSGDYVLRAEVIALHEGNTAWQTSNGDNGRGAQLYIFCGDLTVTGGGSGVPKTKVAIPGQNWVASQSTPGILYDIYANGMKGDNYPTVGPAITTFDVGAPAPVTPPAAAPTPTASPSSIPPPPPAPIASINPAQPAPVASLPPGVAPLPPPAAPVDPNAAPVSIEYVKIWQTSQTFGVEVRIAAKKAGISVGSVVFMLPNAQVITGVSLATGRYDGSNLIFTLLDSNKFLSTIDATAYFELEGTYNSINDGPQTASVVVDGQTYTVPVSRRSQLDATGELPKVRPANFGGVRAGSNAATLVAGPLAIVVALVAGAMAL